MHGLLGVTAVSYTHLDVYKRQALNALGNVVLDTRNGTPIRVQDVATVSAGSDLRTGAATMNGEEVVLGLSLIHI